MSQIKFIYLLYVVEAHPVFKIYCYWEQLFNWSQWQTVTFSKDKKDVRS